MEFKSFFKFWAMAAFAVTALTFTSCNDDEEDEPTPEPEFQTIVDNSLVSADTSETANYGGVDYPCVKVAETLQIKYSGSGEPEWTCSDESLALVDQNGLVTGIDAGLVTITATVTEEWSETISSIRICVVEGEIEVVQDDSLITYETEDYYEGCPAVQIEETLQLTYIGEGTPEWKSDTERVASVDQNGLVTGLFVGGPVKITATVTTDKTMTISTVELYVIEHAIAEVEDNDLITAETEETAEYEGKSYTAVKVGLDLQLGYSGEGTPEWAVDNEEVATIDQTGKLTGVSEGLVTVTAVATVGYVQYTSTVQICVYIEYVADDSLLSADTEATADYEGTSYPSVTIGSTLQINYSGTGTPEWSVDDEKIATIDQSGKLTGVDEGLVTVTAVAFADGVQTTATIKICVVTDKRTPVLKTFEEVRAMTTGTPFESSTTSYDYIEGYIVSDCESPNVRSSIPGHTPYTFDADVNYRTAYIESTDGNYGFQLEFDDSSENTLKRNSQVEIKLENLTLSKNSSPEYYTLSGLVTDNITVVAENANVPNKQKTITELTDADIFTQVTISDLEVLQKTGTYANVEESAARKDDNCPYSAASETEYGFDVVPLMLIDKSGNNINMLTNMGSPWRRPAAFYVESAAGLFYQVVPQGSGSLTGVVVADEVVTYRYGDCGTYQLRMIEEGDIQFNNPAFTTSIVEWTWEDGESLSAATMTWDPDYGAGTLSMSGNGYYGERYKDWDNNYSANATGNNGGRGATRRSSWYITTRFVQVSTSTLNDGGWIQFSFSTANISGSNLFFFMTWGGGQNKGNGSPNDLYSHGSNHWHVYYSTDGSEFKDALNGGILDRHSIGYYYNNTPGKQMFFDTLPGLQEVCVNLPAECFGQETVYVRVQPDNDMVCDAAGDWNVSDWYEMTTHGLATMSDTSTNSQACVVGTIAIRYN